MTVFTLKQIDKHIDNMIKEDTSLSRDTVFDAIAGATETEAEVIKAAFKGDGTVKVNQEVLDKIAKHLEMKDEAQHPCGPGQTPEKDGCVEPPTPAEAQHPCGPGQTPEKDGCIEPPAETHKSTLKETLESTFGPKQLENQVKGVLEVINSNKDDATKRYISEVVLKIFETIPSIISAEIGDSTQKIVTTIDEMEKKVKLQETTIEELKAKLKDAKGLTETLSKNAKAGKTGKGLYEQTSEGTKSKGSNKLTEQSMAQAVGAEAGIPNFES